MNSDFYVNSLERTVEDLTIENNELRDTLTDVMVMFENINHNHNMPSGAAVQQYIALGRHIRKVLGK